MRLHQNEFYLEIICGPMFASKTSELYKRYKHASKMNLKLNVFRLENDDRYGEGVSTNDGIKFNIGDVDDLISKIEKYDPKVALIEEAQFYMPMQKFADYVEHLVYDRHMIVIATLLTTNFKGKEFNQVGSFVALADKITTLYSLCTHKDGENNLCGEKATRNQAMVKLEQEVNKGAQELYQPRCRKHFVKQE